ncbi:MAG TPA: endonuclease/exonuclease/phosphatase family protein [Actinomycetota bacterium]
MRRSPLLRWAPLALVAMSVAMTQPAFAAGPLPSVVAGQAGGAVVRLKVMTFNVEYGGTVIDFSKIVEAAEVSDADVIALNEVYGHAARLAADAGYDYVSRRLDVISRYPLLDPAGADGRYIFVQTSPGQVVAITNVHLSSAHYSPREILDGWSRKKVLRNERVTRLPEIRPVAKTMLPLADAGIPSFIVGDFNAPSHLDWVRETVGRHPQVRYPVRWPVSLLLTSKGFVDTYRDAHPSPVADWGTTWPAQRPRSPDSWNPRRDAPRDRIDQIWVAGAATTVRSKIVGERGGSGVDIGVKPWGSDHRAVVSTVDVTPATTPVTVAVEPRRVSQGKVLTATYHAPGDPGERVVIVPTGGDPATDAIDQAPTPAPMDVDGSLAFATGAWAPGGYDAVLVSSTDAELSRAGFFVRFPGAGPLVDTSSWGYDVGEPITVRWEGMPGNRFDWAAIYRRGADPADGAYLAYIYTGSAVTGSVTFDADSMKRWPLAPGRYTAWVLVSDVYRAVGGADFVVR